jgi:uncharacterized BrkB/YihY/UPF0761 family membrane protein
MQANPYIGRIVVLLTPILAGVAGYIAQLAAKYLPGAPELDQGELTAIFVAGAAAVIPVVVTWLYNLGKHETKG